LRASTPEDPVAEEAERGGQEEVIVQAEPEPEGEAEPVDVVQIEEVSHASGALSTESEPVAEEGEENTPEPEDSVAPVASEEPVVQEVEAMWTSTDGKSGLEAFMAHITGMDAPLAGELAQGKLELAPGSLSVRFRSSLFAARFGEGSPSRQRLTLALQTFFSDQVTLNIDQLLEKRAEDETHYEEGERVLQEQYTARRDEVKEHPSVQNLVDTFEGEVVQIRLLGVDD